jgi:hypothetical protein
VWSRDGRELFYRNDDAILGVDVSKMPSLGATRPLKVFERDYERSSTLWPNYDVAADGQQFLMVKTLKDRSPGYIAVVLNWTSELQRLVPIAP